MSETSRLLLSSLLLMAFLMIGIALSGGSDGKVISSDWHITEDGNNSSMEFVVMANITVDAQFTFSNCHFKFMSDTPGRYGILVTISGALTLSRCELEAGELAPGVKAKAWTFNVQDNGRLAISQSRIRDLGMLGGTGIKRGLAIQTDYAGIFDTDFEDCHSGIVVMGGASPTIVGCTFEYCFNGIEVTGTTFSLDNDNTYESCQRGVLFLQCNSGYLYGGTFTDNIDSLYAVMSNVVVKGAVIDGRGRAARAERNAFIIISNSTVMTFGAMGKAIDGSEIHFVDCEPGRYATFTDVDATSTIRAINSVRFRVQYAGAGSPVEGATVELFDSDGRKALHRTTDSDGLTQNASLLFFLHDRGDPFEELFPFRIVASEGFNREEVTGYSPGPNNFTVIEFVDSGLPELTVERPKNGATYNTSEVTFRGRATDRHSGLRELYYTIDGGDRHNLPLQPRWEAVVDLPEGGLVLEIVAVDLVGNEARVTRHIVVDETAPEVLWMEPAAGNLTRAFSLLVTGGTEPGATVTIGDQELTVDEEGNFSGHVSLGDEEGEQVVVFQLTDAVGNTGTYRHRVMVDRTPPDLNAETTPDYRDFPFVNTSTVTVFGTAEPGATVVVFLDTGPRNETVADGDGRWLVTVELELGENVFTVDAFDAAGNRESYEIIDFYYDTEPPEITVLQPQNGTVTRKAEVLVEVRTEPEARIWVADEAEKVMPLHGELEFVVRLEVDGDNALVVYAQDKAGNMATSTVHVVREVDKDGGGEDGTDLGPWPYVVVLVVIVALAALVLHLRRRVA